MFHILILLNMAAMCTLFGLAVAPTLIVHPSMLAISRRAAVEFFNPFFHKSQHTQMGLSIAVLVLSILITFMGGSWWWLIGAVVLQLSGPYTIKYLMPTNRRIMAVGADPESDEMGKDLAGWGNLHLPRTIMAGAVLLLFLCLTIWN